MKRKLLSPIPPEILKFTFSFLLTEGYNKVLRCVCRRWKSLIPSGCFDPNEFLVGSTFNGFESLCRLAKDWGDASLIPLDFDTMLLAAARGGHEDLCYLAKEWGADVFSCMLYVARHENIRNLAKQWI